MKVHGFVFFRYYEEKEEVKCFLQKFCKNR